VSAALHRRCQTSGVSGRGERAVSGTAGVADAGVVSGTAGVRGVKKNKEQVVGSS
jgi:hypothetical protein